MSASGAASYGVSAYVNGSGSPISIANSGAVTIFAGTNPGDRGAGIFARAGAYGSSFNESPIDIVNSGDISITGTFGLGLRPRKLDRHQQLGLGDRRQSRHHRL